MHATNVVSTGTPAYSGDVTWTLEQSELVDSNAYVEMARDFAISTQVLGELIDPTLRFPVLLHWSFVSSDSTTFKQLMDELDSGLIGTVDEDAAAPDGRLPMEVVETGHVGLAHRTRRGDQVRCWYRGPLVPHPPDGSAERLPLAHVADQLRTVIPDGREDLSLSSAFEIGRLLALSHPSMISAMLQWRQRNYHVARRGAIWSQHEAFLGDVLGIAELADADLLGIALGRGFIRQLTANPDEVIGGPRPLVDPGRPLEWDRPATEVVAAGFGLGRRLVRRPSRRRPRPAGAPRPVAGRNPRRPPRHRRDPRSAAPRRRPPPGRPDLEHARPPVRPRPRCRPRRCGWRSRWSPRRWRSRWRCRWRCRWRGDPAGRSVRADRARHRAAWRRAPTVRRAVRAVRRCRYRRRRRRRPHDEEER